VGCLICEYYSSIAGSTKIILFLDMLKKNLNIFPKKKKCERKGSIFWDVHKYSIVEILNREN
jgi:hypothetical protein